LSKDFDRAIRAWWSREVDPPIRNSASEIEVVELIVDPSVHFRTAAFCINGGFIASAQRPQSKHGCTPEHAVAIPGILSRFRRHLVHQDEAQAGKCDREPAYLCCMRWEPTIFRSFFDHFDGRRKGDSAYRSIE
jgi:hypothetical protein